MKYTTITLMRAARAWPEELTFSRRRGVDRLMLAPTSSREEDQRHHHRVSRQEKEHSEEERCRHRLLSVVAVVSLRVEGGYVGRCLLCGTTGPERADGEAARGALLEQIKSA